ncbi:UNVERIFIED_CONTAM: hypothetical protein HDU68_001122 [Siphonaria sp. JEL0065]|nr:hypothetical protein HDU68_001122 [Siphonaria sp. JEL0065]
MIHIMNPYDSDLYELARQRQLYERRQKMLHEQRLQEQARLQQLRLLKQRQQQQQHQRKKSPSPKHRATFVPSPWHSFPLKPTTPSDSDEDMQSTLEYKRRSETPSPASPVSVTRTIPIRYASEIPREESTETLVNETDSSNDSCSDTEMENLAPLCADDEPMCEQEEVKAESVETLEQQPEESETQQHLHEIQTLTQSFHQEFPSDAASWNTRLTELSQTLEVNPETQKLVLGAKGNRPLLEVEEKLTKMLLKADSIESNGVVAVRDARKALIKEVQRLLEDIERMKQDAVEKVQRGSDDADGEKVQRGSDDADGADTSMEL